MFMVGAAPTPPELARRFTQLTGVKVVQGYGLTEAGPITHLNPVHDDRRLTIDTAGLPCNDTEQKVVDIETGERELPVGEVGEVIVRGPQVMLGYWNAPEATTAALRRGWLYTGDIGRLDAEGFLYITDRKKDLIVTAGGMNIAPQNIENLLKGDPFISQAVVHGDKRPYPVALITLNPEELAKFAREQGILNTDPAALAKHPKVLERVSRIVEHRNADLQSYAKVKKFAVLPEDFTIDNGLLTPTLKIKRKVITDKHREALDSLYRA
jgi:long-chain acyl-CoA synthetase